MLEAIKMIGLDCHFYQASSSEMFGASPPPQSEEAPFYPRFSVRLRRLRLLDGEELSRGAQPVRGERHPVHHESPRRGETFVTRKITRAVARIKDGLDTEICLGNLDATRDWGYAKEYVEAMWLMLQQDEPDDYVVATGTPCSVREFVEIAFGHAALR